MKKLILRLILTTCFSADLMAAQQQFAPPPPPLPQDSKDMAPVVDKNRMLQQITQGAKLKSAASRQVGESEAYKRKMAEQRAQEAQRAAVLQAQQGLASLSQEQMTQKIDDFAEFLEKSFKEDLQRQLQQAIAEQETLAAGPPNPKQQFILEKRVDTLGKKIDSLQHIIDEVTELTAKEGQLSRAQLAAIERAKKDKEVREAEEAKIRQAEVAFMTDAQTAHQTVMAHLTPARLQQAPLLEVLRNDGRALSRLDAKKATDLIDMNKYLTLDELLAVYYHIMVTDRPESPLPAKTKELVNRLKTRAYEKINSKNPAPSVPRGLHPTELGKANILVENLRQAGGQPIARAPHS